jgi:hypothetical protein
MPLEPVKYVRNPIIVGAVQVTLENVQDVAQWCGGTIMFATTEQSEQSKENLYIQVPVERPLNERATRAFLGDWVLELNKSFKVYTDRGFQRTFVKMA